MIKVATIYEKFIYWKNKIAKEEVNLTYILAKIFNSLNLTLEFFEKEKLANAYIPKLRDRIQQFDVSNPFEDNLILFTEITKLLEQSGFFETEVNNIETLERLRKTQYHIWNLYKYSGGYNVLIRKYNNRIDYPSRFLVAKIHRFKKKPFIQDINWYSGTSSIRLIGVANPSCSGKSTAIQSFLTLNFTDDIAYVNLDNFFKKKAARKYCGFDNWEIKDSLMFDELLKCLMQLKRGEPTLIPEMGWTEDFNKLIYPKKIILIDGFILFIDKRINSLLDLKIFIDARTENLLIRRVKREGYESREYIIKVVIHHYKKYHTTLLKRSDVIIDGNKDESYVKSELKKQYG